MYIFLKGFIVSHKSKLMGWYVNKCKIFLIGEWNKYDALVKEGGPWGEMKRKANSRIHYRI
jgi:hypothetical protein